MAQLYVKRALEFAKRALQTYILRFGDDSVAYMRWRLPKDPNNTSKKPNSMSKEP